jgi:hypothetical protein
MPAGRSSRDRVSTVAQPQRVSQPERGRCLRADTPHLEETWRAPALQERRRRIDQALFAVVMEACLHGVSTRKVDDLVRGLSVCADLDAELAAFRDRSLVEQAFPWCSSTPSLAQAEVDSVDRSAVTAERGDEAPPRRRLGTPPACGGLLHPDALLGPTGAVLVEDHDERQVPERRYRSEGSMALLNRADEEEVAQPALIASWSPHRRPAR